MVDKKLLLDYAMCRKRCGFVCDKFFHVETVVQDFFSFCFVVFCMIRFADSKDSIVS